jgi:hypothetical protein
MPSSNESLDPKRVEEAAMQFAALYAETRHLIIKSHPAIGDAELNSACKFAIENAVLIARTEQLDRRDPGALWPPNSGKLN